jgi:plastocyanin
MLSRIIMLGPAAWFLVSCFSQREATAPAEGQCNVPITEGFAGSTVVVINKFAFGPADVTIRAGDRVTWLNCDVDIHTSTADAGQWSSPTLSPGDVFTQSYDAAGEFPYHCTPHPFMTGRVIVQ